MSWLIPLFLTGAMLASGNVDNLSSVSFNHENTSAKAIVQTEETERFAQTYPLNVNGKVSLSNVNGSVTVDVWDNPQIKLEYVKTAESREKLAQVDINIEARQESFSVETNYGSYDERKRKNFGDAGKMRVEYHLTVPRGAVLDQIATVNGSINISNAANTTRASTVNGEVNATNLRGAANLSTVNGTVRADFDQLQAGGRITLETVNGTAELTVPSDAGATVKADTLNGQITNDFGLPVRKGQFIGRNLYGRIGSGDVQIRLSSVNGALSVKRKNDGKTLSPATNLLSNKNYEGDADNNDDDEENRNGAPRVKPPRPPRPPRAPDGKFNNEAVRKMIEESLKEARKEIAAMQSNPARADAEEALKQAAAAVNSPETQARLKEAMENYKTILANANWTNATPRVEDKSESFVVKGTPRVTVDAGNCAVSVRGWDKQEVRYAATRVSKSQSPFDLKATRDGSNINIKVLSGAAEKSKNDVLDSLFFNETDRVRIEIFVPKKSDLKIKTGGEIRLENVSGTVDLQGEDESINVRDADGRLSVGTSGGTIRVVGFRGAFDGRTVDGTMNLEGDFQSFNALADGDGTIVLTLPENTNAVLEANTEIETEAGANLIRENAREKLWRAGRGGDTIYRLSVAADGRVFVRGANALKTIF